VSTRRRRTSGIQRRERASSDALSRRLDDRGAGGGLPDWRLLAIGALLVGGLILVVLVLILSSGPSASSGTQQPDAGGAHVRDGSACRASPATCGVASDPYTSLPGTSGPHWDTPASWGAYSTPQSESQLIHNLEHGGIVIWYDPARLNAEQISQLTSYVEAQTSQGIGGRYKFILSPWAGEELASPIAVTAWRHLLNLEEVDIGAIDAFAGDHYGLSPEPNGGPGPPAS
jgi:hypothetical protein